MSGDSATFTVTLFQNFAARVKREGAFTLATLADMIGKTEAHEKTALPWLKLARFGDVKTEKGSLRHDRNVLAITGIEVDYDEGEIPFAEAVRRVEAAGLKALLYTSPSHIEAAPRWRVVLPLSRELPAAARNGLVDRINGVLGGVAAVESWTLSQSFYFGHVAGREPMQIHVTRGATYIDRAHDLDVLRIEKPSKKNGKFDRAGAAEAVLTGASYHEASNALIGKMAREGVPKDEALKRVRELFEHVPEDQRDSRWHQRYDDLARCGGDIYGAQGTKTADRDAEFVAREALDAAAGAKIIEFVKAPAVLRDRRRKELAAELGLTLKTLDGLAERYRGEDGYADDAKQTQASVLLEIAGSAKLFHTDDDVAYADIEVNDHRETLRVRSKSFREWLTREYYGVKQAAPGAYALDAVLAVVESRARFDSEKREVYLRTARVGGKIYVDLCDDDWRAVEIDPNGWRIVKAPDVRFRRARGMLALPAPESGGSIMSLRKFLNVGNNDTAPNFVLTVGYILGAFSGRGPYPVAAVAGEHGAAKTFYGNVIRALIDPNKVPMRALPRHDHDLYVAGGNALLLAFDNVSTLPDWMSDTLCRLSTGGGFAARALYTDADEQLFDGMRPLLLNGIEDVVTRPDLGDRTIVIILDAIKEKDRKAEGKLWAQFETERPKILGAIMDALGAGLRNIETTKLETLPRMADFALWAAACEGAIWEDDRVFTNTYATNREEGQLALLETDLVAGAIVKFISAPPGAVDVEGKPMWRGTAAELLAWLNDQRYTDLETRRDRRWPRTPRALGGKLRRIRQPLAKAGVTVQLDIKDKDGRKIIEVAWHAAGTSGTSGTSPPTTY